MFYNEVPYLKMQRLISEVGEHRLYIERLNYEIERLAELYMEGQISGAVGKEQQKLQREINKQRHLIDKKSSEIKRLQQKYSIVLNY